MCAPEDPIFCEYFLKIGDEKEDINEHDKIEIP